MLAEISLIKTEAPKKKRFRIDPFLSFYGNHNLVFDKDYKETLAKYVIMKINEIPIPDEIYLFHYDALYNQFKTRDLGTFYKIDKWCQMIVPDLPEGADKYPSISLLGPMGMFLFFHPEYIELPPAICDRVDFYSPYNAKLVHITRTYYHAIITLFGGDHALYVEDRKFQRNYKTLPNPFDTLPSVEQYFIKRYGLNKKPLTKYIHGKYPKYYIDDFEDLQ